MIDIPMRINMLGLLKVHQGSREITRFRTQKTASLLACLALNHLHIHPRDVLIERFWPDSDLKAARTNLSVALNALRRQLEPPGVPAGAVLIADHSHVRLNPETFTTDVDDFEAAMHQAELETETEKRLAFWMSAVALYHGDLLPGFYEDWVLIERDRLRDAYLTGLRQIVKECAGQRQPERAIEYAHRMVQADPLREESYRLLIRLLIASGRPQDAQHQYQELERLLRNELQVAPSTATRELAAQLSHLPFTRRKTLEASSPENFQKQSGANQHSSAVDKPLPPHRIPLQFTRFFGREEEIGRLQECLEVGAKADKLALSPIFPNPLEPSTTARLITLTGLGGIGKTRLAIEVTERVKQAFPGGLWFVPLAELDDPLRLGEALRDVLELPRQTQQPVLDQVTAFLKSLTEPFLLILDNFEQIAAGGAPVVWTLLNRVPRLRCLVTSRQPLSLPGERDIPVLPLAAPGSKQEESEILAPSNLLKYPSVALFVDRAQAARPEFQITPRNAGAIAAICERLEGIPLAIELAAARAKALTPAQILERLVVRFDLLASRSADKGERHRSLWAAIDWSYHLLSPALQHLFVQLSVFRGGWTLEAAEAVCQKEAAGQNVPALDALAQLRGHSLIQVEESSETLRFRMLETLREFAAEQLTLEEREAAERCHAVYFHAWVSGAQVNGSEQSAWFARFDADLDNLRAVLAWSLREGNATELCHQIMRVFINFWRTRGLFSEGRRWYARLLEQTGDAPTRERCLSLYGAGALAGMQGDFQNARWLLGKCMEVAQALGNQEMIGLTNEELGSLAYRDTDYEKARFHYGEALELARLQGNRRSIASVLGNLANTAHSTGDFAACHALHEESLMLWREEGERGGEARTLHNLANLAHSQGHLAEARVFCEQSLEIKRQLADRYGMSASLRGLAEIAMDQGDYATAAACVRESLTLTREINARTYHVETLHLLTELARRIGELEIAARMYGTLEKVREEMNIPLQLVYREAQEKFMHALQESLGTAVYETAVAEGRRLSLDQALACGQETLASHSL